MEGKVGRSRGTLAQVSVLAMTLAGALHLLVVREHWAHAPAHGLFFLVAGLFQIGWSIAFLRSDSEALRRLGFLGSVVLVLLWVLTRLAPAPFGHGPEEVDVAGVATKVCEVACAAALGLLIAAGAATQPRRAAWRPLVGLAIAAFLLTALTYGVARAAEPILPGLSAEAAEQHEHGEPPGVEHEHTEPTLENYGY
jgi:hypothetical protein